MLDEAELFDTVEAAIADLTFVLATTARAHDQAKPVVSPEEAARPWRRAVAAGESVGVLFGRERYGLENHEVALADRIVTLPVNPAFASLNLAQAVLIVAYEWFKLATGGALPFAMPREVGSRRRASSCWRSSPISSASWRRSNTSGRPTSASTMLINLRNIFHRMQATRQDIQTLQGMIMAIAEGRKGPARGGVLDGEQAELLRTLLAEHATAGAERARAGARAGAAAAPQSDRGRAHVVGRARQGPPLRRPRLQAADADRPAHRRLRVVPVRLVIDSCRGTKVKRPRRARATGGKWLVERGYRVMTIAETDVLGDVAAVLEAIGASLPV